MEALACGRPAIVSDIPGNLEWVENGQQGWVFADGNVGELTESILTASRDQALIEKKRHARTRAEEKADWQMNFQVLLIAYSCAVKQKTPAARRPEVKT
jgi:glycosyltransferase involved in cell wall biosynthesis